MGKYTLFLIGVLGLLVAVTIAQTNDETWNQYDEGSGSSGEDPENSTTTAIPQQMEDSSKFSDGEIAGIVCGSVAGVFLLAILAVGSMRGRSESQDLGEQLKSLL